MTPAELAALKHQAEEAKARAEVWGYDEEDVPVLADAVLALAEQVATLTEERDRWRRHAHDGAAADAKVQQTYEEKLCAASDEAETAEAERDGLLARTRKLEEALKMLWQYYLLPISDEQKAQVRAALAEGES